MCVSVTLLLFGKGQVDAEAACGESSGGRQDGAGEERRGDEEEALGEPSGGRQDGSGEGPCGGEEEALGELSGG